MIHKVWALDNTVYRKCPMALRCFTFVFKMEPERLVIACLDKLNFSSRRYDNIEVALTILNLIAQSEGTSREIIMILSPDLAIIICMYQHNYSSFGLHFNNARSQGQCPRARNISTS